MRTSTLSISLRPLTWPIATTASMAFTCRLMGPRSSRRSSPREWWRSWARVEEVLLSHRSRDPRRVARGRGVGQADVEREARNAGPVCLRRRAGAALRAVLFGLVRGRSDPYQQSWDAGHARLRDREAARHVPHSAAGRLGSVRPWLDLRAHLRI